MDVKLRNDKQEREMYENFAIIKATEKLEKLYVISSSDYQVECHKLIAQFKTLSSTLKYAIPRFHETYKLDCPAVINRLVVSGVPATVEHRVAAVSASVVAECVQNFITTMDSLKLNMVAVDQVHSLLSDLSASLNKLTLLGAADELTEQQARQLHFDLESFYNSFMAALPSAGTWVGITFWNVFVVFCRPHYRQRRWRTRCSEKPMQNP